MAKQILIRLNLFIFITLASINLVGVFMPELGFDAIWYHLTLSKLWLLKHQWYFPGGLYYYSAMPRLAEIISLPLLKLIGFSGPKFIQYLSGLLVSLILYRLVKKFVHSRLLPLVAVNLFYVTWLVSWQSSSGYVDLVRTLFEISALYLLAGSQNISLRRKILAGTFLGLAIGTKWHALGSLVILSVIYSFWLFPVALIVASPWFFLAYRFTGNPLYPLFEKFMTQTQLSQVEPHFYSLQSIIARFLKLPLFLTRPSEDFLSPTTGLVFLISLISLVSSDRRIRKISLFGFVGTILLMLTPPPSTRYYLPYLPAVIVAAVYLVSKLKDKIAFWLTGLLTISAALVLFLRVGSYIKFLPYIFGGQNLNRFLVSQSNRLPDTFIDADDYVRLSLPSRGRYLISNLHNLFYFPYDFDHTSFSDPAKTYDYLITKGANPQTTPGQLIHTNQLGIQIFKL